MNVTLARKFWYFEKQIDKNKNNNCGIFYSAYYATNVYSINGSFFFSFFFIFHSLDATHYTCSSLKSFKDIDRAVRYGDVSMVNLFYR